MATAQLPPSPDPGTSTRPYLIRAMHEWCTDNGLTPYLAVFVTEAVQVPPEYVKNHEILLNVSLEATSQMIMGNDYIEFQARFGGVVRNIVVPVDNVVAIYARENGQGMAFPAPGEVAEPVAPALGGGAGRGNAGTAATASRGGLRLAAADGESTSPHATPGAAAIDDAVPAPLHSADGPPERPDDEPPNPPSKRPALKRIK